MSATDDVKYQLDQMKREPDEPLDHFAARLYAMQMEVYSANCMSDLVPNLFPIWKDLDSETKKGWLESAKKRSW